MSINNKGIWSIIGEEPSITELRKENRALDMELTEAYEKIRTLENRLNFLQSFHWGVDPILDNK